MSKRQINQQEAYRAYLTKWGLGEYVFAVDTQPHNKTLCVFVGQAKSRYNVIHCVDTLIKAAKRADLVKLYTGKIQEHESEIGKYSDLYRYFDSWDEFREYCMIVKLSGL